MSETILLAAILIPCLIVAIVFHEVAHGYVAMLLGDPTAKERRRLSLNPVRHVDPVGTLLVPGGLALAGLPVFGWAKPVPVIKQRLDNPRFGMMAVAAAGPGTNFVLALVAAIALGLVMPAGGVPLNEDPGIVVMGLTYFIMINLFLALFNLLPIPPFDGSHIVEGLLPRSAARVYERIRPLGFPLLFVLLLVVPYVFPEANIIENFVIPPVEWAMGHYFAVTDWVAGA
ncbi:site-2 protease family protein [Aurantiacibacter poecillastricola]|uniref:site-2 protease family protein n=1 Tax=Aurantiacibacter poecillastricola TaxID=3064385 RepID=UPI00273E936A|nr:site-2 protease family protein [Aurantiacibacter sp. 219JJ12-13]MDP5262997.1 site-2 protease family protein [Aurantiacibacter sp. 219JJ12-13]